MNWFIWESEMNFQLISFCVCAQRPLLFQLVWDISDWFISSYYSHKILNSDFRCQRQERKIQFLDVVALDDGWIYDSNGTRSLSTASWKSSYHCQTRSHLITDHWPEKITEQRRSWRLPSCQPRRWSLQTKFARWRSCSIRCIQSIHTSYSWILHVVIHAINFKLVSTDWGESQGREVYIFAKYQLLK